MSTPLFSTPLLLGGQLPTTTFPYGVPILNLYPCVRSLLATLDLLASPSPPPTASARFIVSMASISILLHWIIKNTGDEVGRGIVAHPFGVSPFLGAKTMATDSAVSLCKSTLPNIISNLPITTRRLYCLMRTRYTPVFSPTCVCRCWT